LEAERCAIVGGAPAGAPEVGLRSLLSRVVRRRAKLVPEERLQFETLLSELSAGLIHLAAADVDAAIERGLQRVVTFLGVDRGQLDEYAGREPVVRIVWARPGVEAMPRRLMDDDQFPWTAETLRRGQIVRFSRIDQLPPAAALDRANLLLAGTRSKICLPLRQRSHARRALLGRCLC
jgi:formate hydrogenlyase transcriptional activator